MDSRTVEFIQDIVITLNENIRELRERKNFADPEEQSYIDGKLQAYIEVLATLRASADEFNLSRSELGLG
jgi:hypothetical protein